MHCTPSHLITLAKHSHRPAYLRCTQHVQRMRWELLEPWRPDPHWMQGQDSGNSPLCCIWPQHQLPPPPFRQALPAARHLQVSAARALCSGQEECKCRSCESQDGWHSRQRSGTAGRRGDAAAEGSSGGEPSTFQRNRWTQLLHSAGLCRQGSLLRVHPGGSSSLPSCMDSCC